jgi:DNA-binding SARP family transcriptional activator
MAIQLVTFGGLRAVNDRGELRGLLGQHTRAALLVYLAIERRVSRESLTTVFWPESDAENARHALRQSLYHLKKTIGEDWIQSSAHELIVADDVNADANHFAQACTRGDHAAAVALYQGPFLDGVHLVDLQPWEGWVDARRTQYARAFRTVCRELLDAKRAAGDISGLLRAAEQWVERDPLDAEAQHRLIDALSSAGEMTEAIRQYDTYARSLEADGLEVAAETRALVERLRSKAASLRVAQGTTDPVEWLLHPSSRTTEAPTSSAALEPVRQPRAADVARRPTRRAVALTTAVLAVGIAALWAQREKPTETRTGSAAPTTIAVLPFDVRGGAEVAFLHDGMVNLLASALDGAGSLRAADTRATFAAVTHTVDSLPALQRGQRVAGRLGADMFVLGNVTEAGGRLQLEAAIYGVGGGCGPAGSPVNTTAECAAPEPVAKAVISGEADSVFALVDGLAARLLGGLGNPSTDRLRATAGLTTSLAAFKTYLQGEELMRHGQFERAAETYLAALAEDSTFAVAYYRLGLAREWAPLPGEDSAAAAAARHAQRLTARDHNLLDAFRQWRLGDATGAERAYRSILARYPEDIDAWFQLGEILFHHGPLLGRPIAESEEAWRKVAAYEPRNLFAITHLARIALTQRRLSAVDSLLGQFSPVELRTDRRLVEIVLARAVARGDTAQALAVARSVRQWEPFAVWRTAVFLAAFTSDVVLMRRVMNELIIGYPVPGLRADLYWFASMLDLAAGQPTAARASLGNAVESEREVPVEQRRKAYELVTQWYAATLPLPYSDSMLRRARTEAYSAPRSTGQGMVFVNELGMGTPIQLEPLRHYVIGLLSVRLRDTVAVAIAADTLQRLVTAAVSTALSRDLDRGLRAQLAQMRGRSEDALRLLESLEVKDSQGDVAVTPFVTRVNERVLRGDVLAALGRGGEAERWFASLGDGSVSEIPLRAHSASRLAQLRSVPQIARQ